MDQVLQYLEQKEPFPPNSFALTFDDGFENNFSVAEPILKRYSVPAMIYLTTDFISRNSMSWIDRIEFAVELTKKQSIYSDWCNSSFTLNNSENRIQFLSAVRKHVKSTRTCNPNEFADKLCLELGFPDIASSNDPLDKKLSWKQIRDIGQSSKYLSFGGHSHTHAILSFLSSDELNYELDTSLDLMTNNGGLKTIHYSYPEGLKHCYSKDVIQELKKRGIKCCPTAIAGVNSELTDPFHLTRVMVA
jgi:peptidoglycan/xylan/chitin deacetylase (PgdA/CDA1 family)